MKITHVEPILLRYTPPRAPRDGLAGIPSRDVFLLRIDTDEGISGIGEGFALGSLESTAALVNETLTPLLLGQDPTMIEQLWNHMYQYTFRYGRRGILIAGLSAIDIALWDILGKVSGQPVYKLLGGAHDSLEPYASAGYYMEGKTPADLGAEAKNYQDMGFRIMKMKVGGATIPEDMERIQAVRDAVGYDFKLAIDANNAWDYTDALRMARFCEKMDIFFFEEPLSSDHLEDSIRLAEATDVPIAGYETQLTSYGMRDFICRHGVDIAQWDVIWTGGISECRKVSTLANCWNKQCIPHFSASMVSLAANLHCGMGMHNVHYFEYTLDDNPLRDELSLYPIKMKNGRVTVPDLPGIGVELNPDTVAKYRIG
ncbi:MAG: mandelate racemase/muconate lactonizing enzyme family protein [Eubacteriales bacterium]|jgi:D-arabinonate dehydratase